MRTLTLLLLVTSSTLTADADPRGAHATPGPPRITYWWGKVNQHVDLETMTWRTDPDGVSGANLDKLDYCRRWYPDTVEVRPYAPVTITTWRERGNVNRHAARKLSFECVQGEWSANDPI